MTHPPAIEDPPPPLHEVDHGSIGPVSDDDKDEDEEDE